MLGRKLVARIRRRRRRARYERELAARRRAKSRAGRDAPGDLQLGKSER